MGIGLGAPPHSQVIVRGKGPDGQGILLQRLERVAEYRIMGLVDQGDSYCTSRRSIDSYTQ